MSDGGPAGRDAAGDRLITPEAVLLEYPLATVGSRAVAFALDQALLFLASIALFLAGAAIIAAASVTLPEWLGVSLVLLLGLAIQLGYPILFETLWDGRTLGKAAMGLRVLTATGGRVGLRHAALRAIVGIVDFQATGGVAAFVSELVGRRHQRLGDLAAGTVVVRDRIAAPPMEAVGVEVPAALGHYARQLDVSGIDAATYGTVRAYVQRAASLPHDVRTGLGRDLADRVRRRVHPAPPPGTSDHDLLLTVVGAVQARSGGTAPMPGAGAPARPRDAAPPGDRRPIPDPATDPPDGSGPDAGGFTPPR